MKNNEIKKCLVCAMQSIHHFKDCESPVCECNCLSEIHGSAPLPFEECPKWFRIVTRKEAAHFTKIHCKKGTN